MPHYEVSTDDLGQFVQQANTQVQVMGDAQQITTQAVDNLVTTSDAASTQALTAITGRLTELVTQVREWDQAAQAVQWTGQDSERFRESNANLAGAIDTTQQAMTQSIEQYRAQTAQLNAELQDLTATYNQALAEATEQTTQLAQAVEIERSSYEEAFNGSFAFGG